MATLASKIKQHLGRAVNFNTEVILQDDSDGAGPYIKTWNAAEAQPTTAELDAANAAADATEATTAVQVTRSLAYPSIGDQLDMLWHAVDTGDWTAAKVKTTEFYTALKAVKDANPKP